MRRIIEKGKSILQKKVVFLWKTIVDFFSGSEQSEEERCFELEKTR